MRIWRCRPPVRETSPTPSPERDPAPRRRELTPREDRGSRRRLVRRGDGQAQLVDGRCPDHPTLEPQWLEEENYFFALSRYQEPLEQLYRDNPGFTEPEHFRNEVLGWLRDGLRDFSISRSGTTWGIPFPGDPAHRIYVWFDALTNYVTGAGFPGDPASRSRPRCCAASAGSSSRPASHGGSAFASTPGTSPTGTPGQTGGGPPAAAHGCLRGRRRSARPCTGGSVSAGGAKAQAGRRRRRGRAVTGAGSAVSAADIGGCATLGAAYGP